LRAASGPDSGSRGGLDVLRGRDVDEVVELKQKQGTLLRRHQAAFYEWGTVPEELLYDRMKTV